MRSRGVARVCTPYKTIMPVCTRSQRDEAPLIPHADPAAISRAVNTTDPITLEDIHTLPPGVVFLHRVCTRSNDGAQRKDGGRGKRVTHAYDARALFRYLAEAPMPVAPLSRVPFTPRELMDVSLRSGEGRTKYTLLAAVLYRQQCRRLPAAVTLWQQLDWLLALLVSMLEELHTTPLLSQEDVFVFYTLVTCMLGPSMERDAASLATDSHGRDTVLMLLAHNAEVVHRHSRCTGVCAEIAAVAVAELRALYRRVAADEFRVPAPQ